MQRINRDVELKEQRILVDRRLRQIEQISLTDQRIASSLELLADRLRPAFVEVLKAFLAGRLIQETSQHLYCSAWKESVGFDQRFSRRVKTSKLEFMNIFWDVTGQGVKNRRATFRIFNLYLVPLIEFFGEDQNWEPGTPRVRRPKFRLFIETLFRIKKAYSDHDLWTILPPILACPTRPSEELLVQYDFRIRRKLRSLGVDELVVDLWGPRMGWIEYFGAHWISETKKGSLSLREPIRSLTPDVFRIPLDRKTYNLYPTYPMEWSKRLIEPPRVETSNMLGFLAFKWTKLHGVHSLTRTKKRSYLPDWRNLGTFLEREIVTTEPGRRAEAPSVPVLG